MSIPYPNNSDIFIQSDENITDSRLNQTFFKLIDNDNANIPSIKSKPTIWECKWFNDQNINGYDKGQTVWINTESIDDFIKNKKDKIYQYAINNNYLLYKIKPYDSSEQSIVNLYQQLLKGYETESGVKLQPIYYIGELSNRVQIKISKIDNNKDTPDTLSSWDDYYIRSYEELTSFISEYKQYLFDKHITDYHFDGIIGSEATNLIDRYASYDLSDVSQIQRRDNYFGNQEMEGFDYIVSSVYNNADYDIVQTQTSTIVSSLILYILKDTKLSAEYILKNSITNPNIIKEKLSSTTNWSNDKIDTFANMISTNINAFGDITFHLSATNVNGNFPSHFKYTEKDYGTVLSLGVLPLYSVTYGIFEPYKTNDYALISANIQYYDKNSLNILSTYNYNEISTKINMYDAKNISSDVETTIIEKFKQISSFYVQWNSGYLEQGGIIHVNDNFEGIYQIKLPKAYDYNITTKSFYGDYEEFDNGDTYNSANNLNANFRYTISLTPIAEQYDYDILEVNTIKNDSFCVRISKNSPKKFQFRTYGYRIVY